MVPVRFVVESDSLQGQVYWDGTQQKVALDCKGKYIEFYIGSKKAAVDGQEKYLDSAPYIYQDRTYIPLRFLAETLGGTVSWNAVSRVVSVEFKQNPQVFAYYYYTPEQEFKENAHLFSDVAFRWFATNAQGSLHYDYKDNYSEVLSYARRQGIRTHAGVALMGEEPLHTLLTTANYRENLIKQLVAEVNNNNYDGVNIDFEFIAPEDGPLFTSFLQKLKDELGTDKELSVAVFARTGKEKWPTAYQYDRIGEIADRIVVMAYDYSYITSNSGPVAPIWWVKDVIAYMKKNIPREKILLGIPTYGYDWTIGSTERATTVTASKLSVAKSKYKVQEHFDQKSMSPFYTYMDDNHNYHEIWLENSKSLDAKLKIVWDNSLGGISFWRIGNGFTDLYELLK